MTPQDNAAVELEDNGDKELGVEFGSVMDNPAAKNRCMPSLMPSSTARPVRPATTVEAGLATVFEGVLDSASGGCFDTSVYDAFPFTFYCVCSKVSDLHWAKKKVKTYTATPPREQPATIAIRGIWTLFGQ